LTIKWHFNPFLFLILTWSNFLTILKPNSTAEFGQIQIERPNLSFQFDIFDWNPNYFESSSKFVQTNDTLQWHEHITMTNTWTEWVSFKIRLSHAKASAKPSWVQDEWKSQSTKKYFVNNLSSNLKQLRQNSIFIGLAIELNHKWKCDYQLRMIMVLNLLLVSLRFMRT